MARTEDEIFAAIEDEVASSDVLSPKLTSSSATALWRNFGKIIARVLNRHEETFDDFKEEVNAIVSRAIPGTTEWYIKICKEYQHGDTLIILDSGVPGYATISEILQIIKQVAVVPGQDTDLLVKLAKEDAGSFIPLSSDEMLGFQSYFNKRKFAGTSASVLSLNGDILYIAGEYFYDPQTPLQDVKDSVDAEVDAFVKNLPFDGRVHYQDFVDAVQKSKAYKDFNCTHLSAKPYGASSDTDFINSSYNALAGYLNLNVNPSDAFTFTPYVV